MQQFARALGAVVSSKLQAVCAAGTGPWWAGLQSQQCPWEDESRDKSLLAVFINGWQGLIARINYIYLLTASQLD